MMPPDLRSVLDELQQTERRAERLAGEVTDAQFHWQPMAGRGWSIAQCIEHLAVANRVYSAPMREAVDEARTRGWTRRDPIASNPAGRWFISSMEPPVKRRLKAQAKIQPRSAGNKEEILRAYRESHEFLRKLVTDAATIDVNRARFRNPLLPLFRVRVGTGLRVLTAHERRHVWQAERVRAADGYPL